MRLKEIVFSLIVISLLLIFSCSNVYKGNYKVIVIEYNGNNNVYYTHQITISPTVGSGNCLVFMPYVYENNYNDHIDNIIYRKKLTFCEIFYKDVKIINLNLNLNNEGKNQYE